MATVNTNATTTDTNPLHAEAQTPKAPKGYGRLHKPDDRDPKAVRCVAPPVPAFMDAIKPLPARPTTAEVLAALGGVAVIREGLTSFYNAMLAIGGPHRYGRAEDSEVWQGAIDALEAAMSNTDAVSTELAARMLPSIPSNSNHWNENEPASAAA